MSAKQPITETQRTVLQWVNDGCRPEVFDDGRWKVSAYALRDRRLLTVSKRGGGFSVGVTDAGRHYLEHGAYPDGHWLTRTPPAGPADTQHVVAPTTTATAKLKKAAPPRVPVARQLVLDVIAAGGRLKIVRDAASLDWNKIEARVRAAIRHGFVPEGKLLRSHSRYGEPHIVELVDQPEWMTRSLAPIRVPANLTNPHPVVQQLRDDKRDLDFAAPARRRALRLLQAITAEAVRRGYRIDGIKKDQWGRRDAPHKNAVMTIQVGDHQIALGMSELKDRVPHTPTKKEIADHERYSWNRIPPYDHIPNGQLAVHVHTGREYRQSTWTDGKHTLEGVLPQVLQEVELRADHMEQLRLAEIACRDAERRAWEHAMAKAEARMVEAHRADVLNRQLEQWEQTNRLTAYLTAMRTHIDAITDTADRAAATEWLTWAITYASGSSPLATQLRIPQPPKPTADNMKPHLRGWSFYGPNRF